MQVFLSPRHMRKRSVQINLRGVFIWLYWWPWHWKWPRWWGGGTGQCLFVRWARRCYGIEQAEHCVIRNNRNQDGELL